MINFKLQVVILLFLFSNQGFYAQDIFIKGLVLSEDSSPVQYTTIYDDALQSGTFSDSLGRFSMNISSNATALQVSAIGYKNKTIPIDQNDNLSDVQIVLTNDTIQLKEVVISSTIFKPKQTALGPRKKISGHIRFCELFNLKSEVGLYIPNPEQIRGELESIEFYVKKEGDEPNRLVRLRIYSVDENLYPAQDLLLSNILLQAKNSKKYQSIKIDVEKYKISIPSNGIVIALEVVQNVQKPNPNKSDGQNTKTDVCASFEIACADDETNSFVQWDRLNKGNWYNLDHTSRFKAGGEKVTNLVPYAKITINEYAERK
jgi:hypothetical protein